MVNPIIRQLQIDLITDNPNELLNWFNELWKNLHVVEADVYHKNGGEFIYYTIEGDNKKVIFFQDNKNDKFWCNHDNYWSILQIKYSFNYADMQGITKLLVENALKYSVPTPSNTYWNRKEIVENSLNNTVLEPRPVQLPETFALEIALNSKVVNSIATPRFLQFPYSEEVENALNTINTK